MDRGKTPVKFLANDFLTDQDDEQNRPEEVIMALDMGRESSMGCAFLRFTDGDLLISIDVPQAENATAEYFITHAQPTTVLVSSQAPEQLVTFLEKLSLTNCNGKSSDTKCTAAIDANDNNLDRTLSKFSLQIVASSEFSYPLALQNVCSLPVHSPSAQKVSIAAELQNQTRQFINKPTVQLQHRFLAMQYRSLVGPESPTSIGCAGVVLTQLQRHHAHLSRKNTQNNSIQVRSIQGFCLSNFMLVDVQVLASLQIIRDEMHPNVEVYGPGRDRANPKESLSIYGLFRHMSFTPQGRHTLRKMLLSPLKDLSIISARQRAISCLLQPSNEESVNSAVAALRNIKNMKNITEQLRSGNRHSSTTSRFESSVWTTLRNFARHSLSLEQVVRTMNGIESIDVARKLLRNIHSSNIASVGELIEKTVDFEQSRSRDRLSVRIGVDSQLDALKRRYNGLESLLTRAVDAVKQQIPDWARRYIHSCLFIPQLGFLVAVVIDSESGNSRYEGEGTFDQEWSKQFVSDGIACYKNRITEYLDRRYGDSYCEIRDREIEVMQKLVESILTYETALIVASDACGEFDAVLALALGARKYGWTSPRMTNDNTIKILGGRHPLQELSVPVFVPNDCFLGVDRFCSNKSQSDSSKGLILTGPNNSGKSIYLKQVAIIVYLAHIGSFVPAEDAVIGVTDSILARMATRESVSQLESPFATDLGQISRMMRLMTPKSLLLVDEFGKGTNVDDGAGLITAFIDHLISLGDSTPRLLMTTHFHEIIDSGYVCAQNSLTFCHMDVETKLSEGPLQDEITYLYKVKPGYSPSSFRMTCAAMHGIPMELVDRANGLAIAVSRFEDLRSSSASMSRDEESRLEAAEAVAREFLKAHSSRMADSPVSQNSMRFHGKRDLENILSLGTSSYCRSHRVDKNA